MKLGIILVILSFIATLLSAILYYSSEKDEINLDKKRKKKKTDKKKNARLLYYLSVAFITASSAYLYYLIFSHQFQVNYIYQYSSRDLPFGYLLSTFWAGQEGSFLFWVLCISWLGLIFIKTAGKYENYGMLFLNLVISYFLILLIKASPFVLINSNQIPIDGAGLNPLLQNFWMVIHPPILFVGYAAATFPFVIAVTALIKNETSKWISQSLPWVLGVSITLGAGIIIGAFWSYETLGWGGYWGWDPVENSSLIPWLTTIALFHGMLIERRSGALIKSNLFLAIISFVLVLYATFLTRSGILADFSVHSFQNLGINSLLIIFISLSFGLGIGLLLKRFKNLKGPNIESKTLNRENILFFGMVVIGASSFLTILGTSSPIITGWFGEPSQVDISFYNKVNLPIGIVMALIIGFAPLLRWYEEKFSETLKRFMPSIIITIIILTLSVYLGVRDIVNIIFLGLSIFMIISNIYGIVQRYSTGLHNIAAPLSHFGVGLMFVGIIISGNFDQTKRILLTQGKETTIFDKKLTFTSIKTPPDGKNILEIKVQTKNGAYIAEPRLYYNELTRGNMREPDIKYGILTDTYIAPLELRTHQHENHGSTVILKKGDTKVISNIEIHFHGFNMSSDHQTGNFNIGANLKVEWQGETFNITPFLVMNQESKSSETKYISNKYGNKIGFNLTSIDADNKSVLIKLEGLPEKELAQQESPNELIVEVSKKPFMNILWLGTILLTLGTIIAIKTRINDN